MSRQNKAKRINREAIDVHVQSVLRPYKADNVLSFQIRYQSSNSNVRTITRAFLLNTLFMNTATSTVNYRLCAAVRVNRIEMTTSNVASLEWLSAYGPSSATNFTGTSTSAPGRLSQKPPKNSLCSFWSMNGSNESEALCQLSFTMNDYVDVFYSVVLLDQEVPVVVTTTSSGIVGTVYRSYLDGPASTAVLVPLYAKSLN